jgi:hypothetical protein
VVVRTTGEAFALGVFNLGILKNSFFTKLADQLVLFFHCSSIIAGSGDLLGVALADRPMLKDRPVCQADQFLSR